MPFQVPEGLKRFWLRWRLVMGGGVVILLILLLVWLTLELRSVKSIGNTLLQFFLLTALLLSNFPAAWLCMLIASSVHKL